MPSCLTRRFGHALTVVEPRTNQWLENSVVSAPATMVSTPTPTYIYVWTDSMQEVSCSSPNRFRVVTEWVPFRELSVQHWIKKLPIGSREWQLSLTLLVFHSLDWTEDHWQKLHEQWNNISETFHEVLLPNFQQATYMCVSTVPCCLWNPLALWNVTQSHRFTMDDHVNDWQLELLHWSQHLFLLDRFSVLPKSCLGGKRLGDSQIWRSRECLANTCLRSIPTSEVAWQIFL